MSSASATGPDAGEAGKMAAGRFQASPGGVEQHDGPRPDEFHPGLREAVNMGLYLAIVLLAVLIGFGGERSVQDELLLLWGTSVGLGLAHLFAFRLTYVFSHGWRANRDIAREALGVVAAVVVITGIASVPYLFDLAPPDAADVATFLLTGVIGVTGYASARTSGARVLPALAFAAIILLLAALVVGIKYTLTH